MEPTYCVVAECEDPADGHGDKCAMHARRWNRGDRGAELSRPKTERLTPRQRAHEASLAMADADDDYDAKERAWATACRVAFGGIQGHREAVKAGIAAAREGGAPWGRPPKMTAEQAHELLRESTSISRAVKAIAEVLGVSERTVWRHVHRSKPTVKKSLFVSGRHGDRHAD